MYDAETLDSKADILDRLTATCERMITRKGEKSTKKE